MRPVRLELSGFLSYAEPTTLEFAGVEAVAVVGENGAGKTALLEAISWALYGRTRARGADDVVYDGATVARVAFTFGIRGEIYRVVRERHAGKSGKSDLRLERSRHTDARSLEPVDWSSWNPVGGDKIADTQTAIEELLGMSADLFVSTAFVGQGDADRFTELRPAARKALLFELLEFGHYEELSAAAHKSGQIHDSALEKLEGRRQALSEDLEDPDELEARRDGAKELYGSMRADRDDIRTQVASARMALEEGRTVLSGAERARETLSGLKAEREARRAAAERSLEALRRSEADLTEQVRKAEAAVAAEEAVASRFAEVEARATETGKAAEGRRTAVEQALREHEEAKIALERGRERLAIAEERSEAVSRGVCPTCGRSVDDDLAELLDRELAQYRSVVAIASTLEFEKRGRLEDVQADLTHTGDELAAATAEVVEIRRAIAERETWRTRLAFATEHLEQTAGDVRRREEDLRAASEPSEEERRLETEAGAAVPIAELEQAVVDLEVRERERDKDLEIAAETVARLTERLEETRRRHDEVAVVTAELVDLGAQRERFRLLEEAFGRDGIPAELLRRSTAELEAETNEILERLTAGRYTLAIETERALRSGRAADTLDVIVSDDRSDRPLEALSGGERQAVDIALRLGLSRILAARSGHPVELLVLDETFAAFDAGRRQAAVELLGAVRDRFGCVVFVTHDRALAEAFPRRLFVERVGETSRARLA